MKPRRSAGRLHLHPVVLEDSFWLLCVRCVHHQDALEVLAHRSPGIRQGVPRTCMHHTRLTQVAPTNAILVHNGKLHTAGSSANLAAPNFAAVSRSSIFFKNSCIASNSPMTKSSAKSCMASCDPVGTFSL
eukprot:GHVN01080234.1.p1 GENE.GHVN01080234.1~~GHVN01080234.1.p1  ORF type:complete len:131 (+),score=1.27 GHVN01080234.1:344-736(+)